MSNPKATKARPAKTKNAQPNSSLRALAARLGVSHEAIRKAVHRGRLTSVMFDSAGVPVVPDLDASVAEWLALSGSKIDAGTLAEATLALTRQKALTAMLENRERLRELVPRALVDSAWGQIVDEVREAIRAVQVKAEQAGIVTGDAADKLEDLVHEVLERLATRPRLEGAHAEA